MPGKSRSCSFSFSQPPRSHNYLSIQTKNLLNFTPCLFVPVLTCSATNLPMCFCGDWSRMRSGDVHAAIREVWAYHSSTGTALLFKLAECKTLSLSLKLHPLTPNVYSFNYSPICRIFSGSWCYLEQRGRF